MQNLISYVTGKVPLPAVRNETPVPFVAGNDAPALFGSGTQGVMGDNVYKAYGSVGTLYAIASQLAHVTATVEWHLFRRTAIRDKARRLEVMEHAFLRVWERPNPFYTGLQFREAVQLQLDLIGEGIIVLYRVAGQIVEMWPVRPDRMQPVKHPTKFIIGWIYTGPDGEKVPLPLEDVIQIKYPNPADAYRGMGPVQTVLHDIDAARYSAEWNRNFFINGARPGGVITFDHEMSDMEWNKFLTRWRQQHQGIANAHRVAVLENAQWTDTNFSAQDMQIVELRNLPRELIREAFAYPKPMLGTVDDVNRANSDAAKEILAENHTIPRLKRWKDVINQFLLPQFANGNALLLDYDDPTPINVDQENMTRTSQWNAARAGVLAGYHPDDVALATGLPRMRWVGIPTANKTQESESETMPAQIGM